MRRAFLCGKGFEHRKQWIEDRLELLAANFAVSVCCFSVMNNHLHVLCRLDQDVAKHWMDEEVMSRWIAVHPLCTLDMNDAKTMQMWFDPKVQDSTKVAKPRQRLAELGWFMKSLKKLLVTMKTRIRMIPVDTAVF